MPFRACLGDQFKTQDSIFGQKHVLLEDVHALDTFLTKLFGKGVVTVEVLLEWPAHNSSEPVSRESAWQDRDVSKRAFQRFVQDVTDLVLEVLRCHQWIKQISPATTMTLLAKIKIGVVWKPLTPTWREFHRKHHLDPYHCRMLPTNRAVICGQVWCQHPAICKLRG